MDDHRRHPEGHGFFYDSQVCGFFWVGFIDVIKNQAVHTGRVHHPARHSLDGIIVGISVDNVREELVFGLVEGLDEIGRIDVSGIGKGVCEGETVSFDILEIGEPGVGMDYDIGIVKGLAFNLRHNKDLSIKIFFRFHIGTGTDESKVDFPLSEQFIDFLIGFSLFEDDLSPYPFGNIVKDLAVE